VLPSGNVRSFKRQALLLISFSPSSLDVHVCVAQVRFAEVAKSAVGEEDEDGIEDRGRGTRSEFTKCFHNSSMIIPSTILLQANPDAPNSSKRGRIVEE
jgi:hypothetical protein